MRIVFDTEFTGLMIEPRLISIGLVDEYGATFYAEMEDYSPNECDPFVQDNVLPILTGGEAAMTLSELGSRLINWIALREASVVLVTDSAWDWPLIQEIFYEIGDWPQNLIRRPEILDHDPAFDRALDQAYAAGLRRHHALDDAKAIQQAWLARNQVR